MKKYQYIFWDLDGTMINTYEGIANCIRYALEPYGITVEDGPEMNKLIGPPLRQTFQETFGMTAEQAEAAVWRYRERYIPVGVYECDIFPGVKEAIARFHEAGCIQVVTSSKPEPQCREILKKYDILEEFEEVVGASLDGRIDTKIQVLNEAFRRMRERDENLVKQQVVLIGDTRYDAVGAREAGIDCLGITYGFGTSEELLENGAKAVYQNLQKLQDDIL